MLTNSAVIATAGSRKTQFIVDSALAIENDALLITTYTRENQREIAGRIEQKRGLLPRNVTVMGWFEFLIAHGARPYQRALTGSAGTIRGLNFVGRRGRYANKAQAHGYFLDPACDMYRDGVSDFVRQANQNTNGSVIARLERIYRHVFIDEVQDLVGYDLDVLDLLFNSRLNVIVVGDPRQQILSTNLGPRNKKYQGKGLLDWFKQRQDLCSLEERRENYRCNQLICDFADRIYPEYPSSVSMSHSTTGHDGIFLIPRVEVTHYFEAYRPVVLRRNKCSDTRGLPARNIGVAKGQTFDRVLIFPTKPMLKFLEEGDSTKLRSPQSLYVAVTRARHSVAFAMPT